MKDRLLIALACIPMCAGVALLFALSRVPAQAMAVAEHRSEDTGRELSAPQAGPAGWVGVVVASNTAELAAPGAGRVERMHVRTGDVVHAGDPLVQFDRSEQSNSVEMADAQLNERGSELRRSRAKAQAAAKRLERLQAGESWLSKQELERAREDVRVAEAEFEATQASMHSSRIALQQQRLRRSRQTLKAPFEGRVIALDVDTGDSVSAGQVVMRIHSLERSVRFAVPPHAVAELLGEEVRVALGQDEAVTAVVSGVRPEVDPSADMVFAHAALPATLHGDSAWIPGTRVDVQAHRNGAIR